MKWPELTLTDQDRIRTHKESTRNLPGTTPNPPGTYQESTRTVWFWLILGGLPLSSDWFLVGSWWIPEKELIDWYDSILILSNTKLNFDVYRNIFSKDYIPFAFLEGTITTNCKRFHVFSLRYWARLSIFVLEMDRVGQIQKQPPEVFFKKVVLRNFAKFKGKHLCQSPFFIEQLRTTFWQNTSGRLLLQIWIYWFCYYY